MGAVLLVLKGVCDQRLGKRDSLLLGLNAGQMRGG